MSKLYKSRHLPYKLLAKLIYAGGNRPRITLSLREGIRVGSLAKSLRTSNSRVIEALEWLEALSFIEWDYSDDKKKLVKISISVQE